MTALDLDALERLLEAAKDGTQRSNTALNLSARNALPEMIRVCKAVKRLGESMKLRAADGEPDDSEVAAFVEIEALATALSASLAKDG